MNKFKFILISVFLLCFFAVPVFAAESLFTVRNNYIAERRGTLEISGTLPHVTVTDDARFSDTVNGLIANEFAEALLRIPARRASVDFSYDIYTCGDIVSILIHINERTANLLNEAVRSVNFNVVEGKAVKLSDSAVLGINGVKLVNRVIKDEAGANIDFFNAVIPDIDDNHTFYLRDSVVHLVFDRGAVAPAFRRIVEIPVAQSKIRNMTVGQADFVLLSGFNIRMAALRPVAEEFGFSLNWYAASRSIEIHEDTHFIARLIIGRTVYTRGKTTSTLDVAPLIRSDHRAYVPVSFFEDALGISYTVTGSEIVFSRYMR